LPHRRRTPLARIGRGSQTKKKAHKKKKKKNHHQKKKKPKKKKKKKKKKTPKKRKKKTKSSSLSRLTRQCQIRLIEVRESNCKPIDEVSWSGSRLLHPKALRLLVAGGEEGHKNDQLCLCETLDSLETRIGRAAPKNRQEERRGG